MTGMYLRVAVVPLVRANMWTQRFGEQRVQVSPWRTRARYGSMYS